MLYHYTSFPAHVLNNLPSGVISLTFSQHALMAAKTDRYGAIEIHPTLDLDECQIIEVDDEQGKVVYRTEYNRMFDICVVVIHRPDGVNFVKTVWLNRYSDNHASLRRERYEQILA